MADSSPSASNHDLTGRRVLVMGLGRFGGGVGAARYAAQHGAEVLVTDMAAPETLEASVEALDGFPVRFRLGEHREEDFRAADVLIVNPAVDPRSNRYLAEAREAGAQITSEIRLLAQRIPPGVMTVGITGSAGKSTVTAMIGHALSRQVPDRRIHVGGNLGGSLLEQVDGFASRDIVVLELSSFMLEGLALDAWSPRVAVVTNLAPNHLDRHGTFEAYVVAKQAITRHQANDGVAVLGTDAASWPTRGEKILIRSAPNNLRLFLPGEHNRLNAALAKAAGEAALGTSWPADVLEGFHGLPHRLQFVCEHESVRYYNDSKSTTPESAMLGMASFPRNRVHVILGGYDKRADLAEMSRFAADHCRGLYAIGQTGSVIAEAARGNGPADVVVCQTLTEAVCQLHRVLAPDQIVLLSPGCASWDQFENFEQRGAKFIEAVLACTGEGS